MRNFDDLYMEMAGSVSKMSRARRAQVGALLVRDNNILAFGFNGTPSGFDNNCEDEVFCFEQNMEVQLKTKPEVLHAESNALMKMARSTQTSENSTLYITLSPCLECAKLIVQAGVKRVVYGSQYKEDSPITFLRKANIEVVQHERAVPLGGKISSTNYPRVYFTGKPEEDFYYAQG